MSLKLNRLILIAIAIFFAVSLIPSARSNAQINLDGKQYAIDLMLKGVHDSFDTLRFEGAKLTYNTARKYGFAPAEYKAKEKSTGRIIGTAMNESKQNGTMLWNFVVIQDSIAGIATFDSRVRNAVTYDFTGRKLE